MPYQITFRALRGSSSTPDQTGSVSLPPSHSHAGRTASGHFLAPVRSADKGFITSNTYLTMTEEGLFKFEPNLATLRDELGLGEDEDIPEDDLEEAKEEAFEQWKDEYVDSLPEDELIAFIERFFNAEVENDVNEYDFTIEIPEEIVDMAK